MLLGWVYYYTNMNMMDRIPTHFNVSIEWNKQSNKKKKKKKISDFSNNTDMFPPDFPNKPCAIKRTLCIHTKQQNILYKISICIEKSSLIFLLIAAIPLVFVGILLSIYQGELGYDIV